MHLLCAGPHGNVDAGLPIRVSLTIVTGIRRHYGNRPARVRGFKVCRVSPMNFEDAPAAMASAIQPASMATPPIGVIMPEPSSRR